MFNEFAYGILILETPRSEHLTTKKQIESVREMFGEDNWLHSHAGSYVQDILGIKQQSENESFSQEITVCLYYLYYFTMCSFYNLCKIKLLFQIYIGTINY